MIKMIDDHVNQDYGESGDEEGLYYNYDKDCRALSSLVMDW